MKKILVLFVAIAALGLAGCSSRNNDGQEVFPWPVIFVIKYELNTEIISQDAVAGINIFLQSRTQNIDATAKAHHAGKTLQIEIEFDNYKTFLQFNGINPDEDDLKVIDIQFRERLFFLERTITFENPWLVIQDNMTAVNQIDQEVRTRVGQANIKGDAEHIFVLRSSFRRTNVTGNYKNENMIIAHYYYFRGNGENVPEQVKLFDRFANQPIWYAIGLGATGIFMLGMYFVLRKPKNPVQL